MTALLYTENVVAKTHQGTHTKFSELFVKSSVFPKSVAIIATTLFDKRQEAGYDLEADISIEEAKGLVEKAIGFYTLTKLYFDGLAKQEVT